MATSSTARRRPITTSEDAPTRRPRRPSKFKRLMRSFLLVLLVVVGSVGATLYYTSTGSVAASLSRIFPKKVAVDSDETLTDSIKKPVPTVVEKPIFTALDPFTVTLLDGGRSRILHVAITLRVDDEASVKLLKEYMPVVRDRTLKVLSEQNPNYIQTPEGREQLVHSLQQVLNSAYDDHQNKARVSSVLFTAFVIQ